MASELVILGFGNPLRRDDGFGPFVIERLSEHDMPPWVIVLARATLTPDLAETLAEAQSVIFIDASADLEPGRVEHRRIDCDPSADAAMVHALSPGALLSWTMELYGRAPQAELWLVGVETTDIAEGLTETLRGRVPEFVAALEERIRASCP